jgi:uncharacterized membrane protein
LKSEAVVAHVVTPLLGVSTGIRSVAPLAVVSWFASTGKLPVTGTWAAWIRHPAAVAALTAAATAELVADKLPSTPARTTPGPLFGRLALGATVGAILATAFRRKLAGGIAMGAVGALAGSYGGYYLRRGLTKGTGWPDLPVALSGDAASVTLAACALQKLTAAS